MAWLFVAVLVAALVLSLVAWRLRRPRLPSIVELRASIERDIAAAEAKAAAEGRTLVVDRTDRIAPARPRIKF